MSGNEQEKNEKVYSMLKFEEVYRETISKIIDFFCMAEMKKYMNMENKTKYEKEVMENILAQIRDFLNKKGRVIMSL